MLISKEYISPLAKDLLTNNPLARVATEEVYDSIRSIVSEGKDVFILNNAAKNCNGVVPIKENCYIRLEDNYLWFREKPLTYLHSEQKKGGPIDVYKEFTQDAERLRVGLEFETGNISSAHRSINKLKVGLMRDELDLAIVIMPVKHLSFYLTDRVSNYEELAPYFILLEDTPFIVMGFDAEEYSKEAAVLAKGKDGMSNRSTRLWNKK